MINEGTERRKRPFCSVAAEISHTVARVSPAIAEFVPRLSFILDDLSHVTDEELERRALGLVPVLTLWALRDARDPKRLPMSLGRWAGTMATLLRAPNGREALWTLDQVIGS